jgi:asparagine synthase (glutamine-hydrolysing)
MSVQFGIWNQDGRPVDHDHLEKARALLAPYGPDGCGSYEQGNIGIVYHVFHTTNESYREIQPHTTSGVVITWDGRLDNRAELISRRKDSLNPGATDLDIVAAAYERWGTGCFGRLIGDWALSIWNPRQGSLILAKDPIGTRHLYYTFEKDQLTWSTILDPLVLLPGKTFALEEEYIAGWLSFFPATHLTPYAGIHAVPPSSFVLIRPGKQTVSRYWDFDPGKRIRYGSDAEYEEHFRSVFRKSVRRRLRSDSPVLAELSGGMDSSSIVCMADTIIASGLAETPRLDTVSYYDESEPNWNERPYFTKIEEKRGRVGTHIDVGLQQTFKLESTRRCFEAAPGSRRQPNQASRQFAECLVSGGYRVVLSGTGGDEVTGGVPTPDPELQNLLARAQFALLCQRLKVWALNKRTPWFRLLFHAAKDFFPPSVVGLPENDLRASFLDSEFRTRHASAVRGYPSRLRRVGPLPSFQESLATLNALRRQLNCYPPLSEPPQEKRYPYLDRDLLEFLYAIPREQLVRPGQRRSLLRRALHGIVPDEILHRKRKAFGGRSAMRFLSTELSSLDGIGETAVCVSLGIIDRPSLSELIRNAREGIAVPVVTLMRTIGIEAWLRGVIDKRLVNILRPMPLTAACVPTVEHREIRCHDG